MVYVVVVEKPFTPTHAEAEELIALAKKHGRILTVYQSRRRPSNHYSSFRIYDRQSDSTTLCCGY